MQEEPCVPFSSWKPPQIDGSRSPRPIAQGRPRVNDDCPQNFFRCAKWSPDGSRILGQCEDRSLQMLRLSEEPLATENDLHAGAIFAQAAPILDFAWYPGAHALTQSTFCFLASVRECPVKLLDAENGRLRASYKIVDHRERQVAPHSIAFNPTATHFYCGYEDAIEVFDLQRPGDGFKLPTTPSKKSKEGMKGIVSSISFCSDYSGLFAASSLSSAITLFTEASGSDPVAYIDGMENAITQVKFDPSRPNLLYAAQRRSSDLLCWDVREPHEILRRFRGPGPRRTNQKSFFDIDPAGRWLCCGEEDGHVSIFDLHDTSEVPITRFCAHEDSIGSVSFNPLDASLSTVSGSRHFDALSTLSITHHDGGCSSPSSDSSDKEIDTESSSRSTSEPGSLLDTDDNVKTDELKALPAARMQARQTWPSVRDNAVKVWVFERSSPSAAGTDVPHGQESLPTDQH